MPPNDGNTWAIVDQSGMGDYTTIRTALDASEKHVFVRAGTYTLSNAASLRLTQENAQLIGESKNNVIIQYADGICGDMVHIDANGATVAELTVKQTPSCPWTAITTGGYNNITVRDNIIYGSDTMFAIFFAGPEHSMGQEPLDLVENNQLNENNKVLNNEIYSNTNSSFGVQIPAITLTKRYQAEPPAPR